MQAQESPAPSLRAPRIPPNLSVFFFDEVEDWRCLSSLPSPVKNVKNSSLPHSGLFPGPVMKTSGNIRRATG